MCHTSAHLWQETFFFFTEVKLKFLGKKEDRKGSRRKRRGLKLRELLHAPRCEQGGWPGKVKVVPHQSLPYASGEMDPAGHFIFLFLISSFERWRRRGVNGWCSSLKMDGPGVTQEQRGFNVKIKACYLRLQGSFFCQSIPHLPLFFFTPPVLHLFFSEVGVRER